MCRKRGLTMELYPRKPHICHMRAGQPLETLVAEMVFRECGREDRECGKFNGMLVAM